jgi:peptide/nickel transport system permease protein
MMLGSGPTIPGPITVAGDITSKNFLGHMRDIAFRYLRSPVGVLALAIFVSMVIIAIIGPSMYSYSPISWFQGDVWRGFLDGAGAPVLAVVIVSIMVGVIGVFGGLLSGFVGRVWSYPVALLADFALAMPLIAMIGFRAMADGTVNLFWTLFTLGFYASAAAILIVRDGVLMSKRRIQSSNPQFKGTGATKIRLSSLLPATLARTMYVVKFAVVSAIGTVIASDFLGFSNWGSWGSIESDAFQQSVFLTGDWGWVLLPSICIFLTMFSSYLMFDKLERILAEKFPD